jgi:hypothetical protein
MCMNERKIRFFVIYFVGLVFCSAIVITFIRYIVFKDFVSIEAPAEEVEVTEQIEDGSVTE